MQRISIVFFIITFCVMWIFPRWVYAESSTFPEVIQRIELDSSAIDNFVDQVSAVESSEDLLLATSTLKNHLDQSSALYARTYKSPGTDAELKSILSELNAAIGGLNQTVIEMENSFDAENDAAFISSFEQFDSYVAQYNLSVDKLNQYGGLSDYGPFLFWSSIISFIVSAVLFFLSKSKEVLPSEILRNKIEFELFKSSLWPLGGSLISYVWHAATPAGGTYLLLTGPIFIGYFQFLRGLVTYFKEHRPAINAAKAEEHHKLTELLKKT